MRVSNPNARTLLAPALVDKKSDSEKHTTKVTTRKFDVEHYEKTRELVFLDEEGTEMPSSSQFKNGKRLKDEITTIEQFEAIGSYFDVAKKYEVSKTTAHSHKMSLKYKAEREAKEANEMTETEITQGRNAELEGWSDLAGPSEVGMNPSETYHVPSDGQNVGPVESEVNTEGDCPKRGMDEPQGMTEEENMTDEEWEAQVSEVEKQWDGPSEMDMMQAAIRMSWDEIRAYLAIIRKKEIELVDERIKAKLQGMMEGMA